MKAWLALTLLFLSTSLFAELQINITGANVRRPRLAVGKIHPLPNSGAPDILAVRELEAQVKSDLEFTNLFDFVAETAYADLDKPRDIYQMKFEDWTGKGISYVLKMGYKVDGGKTTLEALLYDIPGQKKVIGTRYQYPTSQSYRVVHAMTEDIMKELAGEKGLFSTRIAMVCRDPRKIMHKDVFIVDTDGRNAQMLTNDKTLTLSPAWSPDGKYLLYTQYAIISGVKRGTILRSHNLTNGDRKILSAREGMNSGAAWSPKGDKLALTLSYNGRPEIYLMSPNGGEPEPLSRNVQVRRVAGEGFQPSYQSLLFDVEPRWSPDATKMVFSSARSGHPMIYTVDLSNKIANQLTFAGTYNATPDWSPKGDKILFAAQRLAEGNFDVYVIDPDGNNLNRVTNGEKMGRRRVNSENPVWGPTGRHFVFATNEGGGGYSIVIMSLDGSVRRRISPPGKDCSNPAWGPVL